MIKGNKGEWSEYYAFLKLLVDGRLDFGGPGFQKLDKGCYIISRITRTENSKIRFYEFGKFGKITIFDGDKEIRTLQMSEVKEKVRVIFKAIAESSERTFSIEAAGQLMTHLDSTTLNAGNQLKEDLILKIHDEITGSQPEIGFSIKSMVGSPATLLNASGATNFIYEIIGLDESKVSKINGINTRSKIRDRLDAIKDAGGRIVYSSMESKTFEENLRLCDTVLPEIISMMLLFYNIGRGSSLGSLIDQIVMSGEKILDFQIDRVGLEHKIGNLLYAVALGMVPNSQWDGFLRAYGGYIIVRDDGELVGYNVYNADIFRKYLINSTKFETASSSRHGFGSIYKEGTRIYIKLNFQIRFKK